MDFLHEEGSKKGRFHSEDNRAEIVYNWFRDDAVIIEHTEVDESLAGQGIGKQLVNAVVAWAREKGIRLLPLCVFAKGLMEKDETYQDVLYKG